MRLLQRLAAERAPWEPDELKDALAGRPPFHLSAFVLRLFKKNVGAGRCISTLDSLFLEGATFYLCILSFFEAPCRAFLRD